MYIVWCVRDIVGRSYIDSISLAYSTTTLRLSFCVA